MKKTLMTLAAVLCCAMTTTVFTSCGDDDNDEKTVTDDSPVAVELQYSLKVTDQMLDAMKLTAEYYDASGQLQSEQVTAEQWTKTIKPRIPASIGLRLKAVMKDGANVDGISSFNLTQNWAISYTKVSASGKQLGTGMEKDAVSATMAGDKVAAYLDKKGNVLVNVNYDVDDKGQFTYVRK